MIDTAFLISLALGAGISMASFFTPYIFSTIPRSIALAGFVIGILLICYAVSLLIVIPLPLWGFWVALPLIMLGLLISIYYYFPPKAYQFASAIFRGVNKKSYNDIASELSQKLQAKHPNLTTDKLLIEFLKNHLRKRYGEPQKLIYAMCIYNNDQNLGSYSKSKSQDWDLDIVSDEINEGYLSELLRKNELTQQGLTREQFIDFLKENRYILE